MVKPLGPFVRQEHIVERDYLTTLLIVVPKYEYCVCSNLHNCLQCCWFVACLFVLAPYAPLFACSGAELLLPVFSGVML